jgi:hypothetical protein
MASAGERGSAADRDEQEAEDVLAAFNAEGVIEHPGRPEAEVPNPVDPNDDASDAQAPPP